MVTVSYHACPMYSLVWAATMANFFPEIIQNCSKYIFKKIKNIHDNKGTCIIQCFGTASNNITVKLVSSNE